MVGISYRVMFRRDPVPTALASVGLRHVHGAVYISGDTLRPGVQVKGQIAPMSDMADHAFTGYSGALHATCKAQSNREKASGWINSFSSCLSPFNLYAELAKMPHEKMQ